MKKVTPNVLAVKNGISYEVLNEEDVVQTSDLIAHTFTRAEPMTKILEITHNEFFQFAELFCKKTIDDRLSVIARDQSTSEIIGFVVSEDLASPPPNDLQLISSKFDPVLALLQSLDERYERSLLNQNGRVFHLFMGGVHLAHERQHIFTITLIEALRLALRQGFSTAIAEPTGPISQQVLINKFGFSPKFSVEYELFKHKGNDVFSNIQNVKSCMLVEKQLTEDNVDQLDKLALVY